MFQLINIILTSISIILILTLSFCKVIDLVEFFICFLILILIQAFILIMRCRIDDNHEWGRGEWERGRLLDP